MPVMTLRVAPPVSPPEVESASAEGRMVPVGPEAGRAERLQHRCAVFLAAEVAVLLLVGAVLKSLPAGEAGAAVGLLGIEGDGFLAPDAVRLLRGGGCRLARFRLPAEWGPSGGAREAGGRVGLWPLSGAGGGPWGRAGCSGAETRARCSGGCGLFILAGPYDSPDLLVDFLVQFRSPGCSSGRTRRGSSRSAGRGPRSDST